MTQTLKEKIVDKLFDFGNLTTGQFADQIIAILKKSLLDKLPKEKDPHFEYGKLGRLLDKEEYEVFTGHMDGFNSCLSDITKIIENI